MADWAVIQPDEREQLLATVARPVIRATVSANLTTIKAWAHQHGVTWHSHNYLTAVDAYIVARYEESNVD